MHRFSQPSRIERRLCIDTNVIIDKGSRADVNELFQLAEDAWVTLVKTDVLNTERIGRADGATARERLAETAGMTELLGPWVWDHSRWGHTVWGSDKDDDELEEVKRTVFPGVDWSNPPRNALRDAMHVNTARRYACDGFVTRDEDVLRAHGLLGGFNILSPDQAVSFIERLRRNYLIRHPEIGPNFPPL